MLKHLVRADLLINRQKFQRQTAAVTDPRNSRRCKKLKADIIASGELPRQFRRDRLNRQLRRSSLCPRLETDNPHRDVFPGTAQQAVPGHADEILHAVNLHCPVGNLRQHPVGLVDACGIGQLQVGKNNP